MTAPPAAQHHDSDVVDEAPVAVATGHGVGAALAWARRIWRRCPPADRRGLVLAFAVAVLAVAVSAAAPLCFARVLDALADDTAAGAVAAAAVAFLALRFFGQAMTDLRWVTVNPLLYRIAYRHSLDLGRAIAGREVRGGGRTNRVAEVSHSVAVIEQAQTSLMAFAYNLVVLVVPVVVEVAVMLVVTAVALGPLSPVAVLAALAASGASVLILREAETRTLQAALEADHAVYREMGQVIGFAPLIREFGALPFFQARLARRIGPSLDAHGRHFRVKALRALVRTAVSALCYGAVLAFVLWRSGPEAARPGDLFLVLAYLDRLAMPLASLATAVIAIENALVGLRGAAALLDPPPAAGGPPEPQARVEATAAGGTLRIDWDGPGWPAEGLAVERGDRILVSGVSGAGKTTLLAGIRAAAGRAGLPAFHLPEKPLIVEDDVRGNLALGHSGAVAADWTRFWAGLDGRPAPGLGQAADSLSAGETQLLAVIRALDRRPDLLFIDEGLSAMDRAMEAAVLAAIDARLPGSVVFLVSHRPIPAFRPRIRIEVADGAVRAVSRAGAGERCAGAFAH